MDVKKLRNWLFVCSMAIPATELMAAQLGPQAVEPFRMAEVTDVTSTQASLYYLPLDKIHRSGGGWEPRKILTIKGDVLSSVYKISRSAVLDEVYLHYKSQINASSSNILFECTGRGCGSSNAWANNFFKDYRLNGADGDQYLLVTQQQDKFHVMYVNRRGAGDVMVRLDQIIQASSETPNAFAFNEQIAVTDIPSIRRFLEDNGDQHSYYVVVTASANTPIMAFDKGVQFITELKNGLGPLLVEPLHFINLGDSGKDAFGLDKVTFIRR